jgi:ATP-dependent helicase/nuclease subunit A
MTRAADRLIVCGADGERKRPDGCWYDLIRRALDPYLVEESDGDEKVWRFRKTAVTAIAAPAALSKTTSKLERPEFPLWLRQTAPVQSSRPAPLSPSSAFAEDIGRAAPEAARDRQKALQRGQIVHRLMQSLPDLPQPARGRALERYLANANLSVSEQAEIARQVLGIIEDGNFAEVFAAGSRPEVPIVGRIPRAGGEPILVSGQVDRLSVAADDVLAIDYKTDSTVPAQLENVPAAYVTQLALYRAVLSLIYPAKRVRAALLFSGGPRLIEIPLPVMDAAIKTQLAGAET